MASTYTVERSVIIHATTEVVFEQVSKFGNWETWSPWEELDPEMEKTFHGTDGEVGSGYSWTGNRKAGAGSMKLTAIEAPIRMVSDLNFERPFKSSNTMGFQLTSDAGSTSVTWTMTATHNLMTKVMNVFGLMDRQIGKDFEKGLGKLKSLLESS